MRPILPPKQKPSSDRSAVNHSRETDAFISAVASVDTPHARSYDVQQMTIGIADIERLGAVFPGFPQLKKGATPDTEAAGAIHIAFGIARSDLNNWEQWLAGQGIAIERELRPAIGLQ